MVELFKHNTKIRMSALLSCSASILLAACGGPVDPIGSAQLAQSTSSLSPTALSAPPQQSNRSDAAAMPTAAEFVPAEADATVAGADQAPAEFTISGYGGEGSPDQAAPNNPDVSGAAGGSALPFGADAQAPAATDPAMPGATRLLAASTFQLFATNLVPATPYKLYVATTGNDSNPGTADKPFKTIARAATAVKPGTTVFVAPGTYAGGFKTTQSGTAANRIYYVSTKLRAARIVPPSSSSNDTAWDNRGSYVDIIGFTIDGTKSGGGKKWTHGIYSGGSLVMIRKNHIHHIAKTAACTSAGGSAIGIDSYYRGVKSEVIANMVNDIGPVGCRYIQGIYISTSGLVMNNIVYRVAEAGIHLWHDANNVVIANNTVADSHTGIVVGGGDFYHTSSGAVNTHVVNNIVYDNAYGISEQGKTGKNNTYRNNLVYQNSTYNWSLKNGLSHSGTVTSAPLFEGYATSGTPNFKLSRSSPAIGRGTSIFALPTDYNGKTRSYATGFDIGAYQAE
ncbi:DUF1565 domain-containing protein [Massilia glaciei]|uniref:DUF1565 domain-containing protein n=1 Tax=Massilia glaciei TaxID=1524097 RepID=A0A2U2HED8_9BURK|nr:DUF1565 domain-containing protein [Massilia glaciei]PWF41878.1 DUF1565 domain-containing protein [Massilia glaciei]